MVLMNAAQFEDGKEFSNLQINEFSNFIQFEYSNFFSVISYLVFVAKAVAGYPHDIAIAIDEQRYTVFLVNRYFLLDEKITQFLPGSHPQRVKTIALLPSADS